MRTRPSAAPRLRDRLTVPEATRRIHFPSINPPALRADRGRSSVERREPRLRRLRVRIPPGREVRSSNFPSRARRSVRGSILGKSSGRAGRRVRVSWAPGFDSRGRREALGNPSPTPRPRGRNEARDAKMRAPREKKERVMLNYGKLFSLRRNPQSEPIPRTVPNSAGSPRRGRSRPSPRGPSMSCPCSRTGSAC